MDTKLLRLRTKVDQLNCQLDLEKDANELVDELQTKDFDHLFRDALKKPEGEGQEDQSDNIVKFLLD